MFAELLPPATPGVWCGTRMRLHSCIELLQAQPHVPPPVYNLIYTEPAHSLPSKNEVDWPKFPKMTTDSGILDRYCLVTVGATVGFEELTKQVLQPAFWQFLSSQGFTELHIQCGPDISWASAIFSDQKGQLPQGFQIDVFDVKNNLMKDEMVLCQARAGERAQGLVISHAGTYQQRRMLHKTHPYETPGTGTILDAWKMGLPLVVVPNTSLLNDHQTEMAKHLMKQGYATMSSTE